MVLLDTGFRASELCNINIDDINFADSSILFRQGKGRKPRFVFFGRKTRKQLRKWLWIKPDEKALFTTQDSYRIAYTTFWELLRRLSWKTGIKASPHDFRRTFCLNCLRSGMDLLSEHPQFTLTYAAGVIWPEAKQLFLIPHARIHFFYGRNLCHHRSNPSRGNCTHPSERWTVCWMVRSSFAVIVGGGIDLIMGGLWYQHGSPLYFMARPLGFGWEFFYVCLVAWVAALVLSYKPIFAKAPWSIEPPTD